MKSSKPHLERSPWRLVLALIGICMFGWLVMHWAEKRAFKELGKSLEFRTRSLVHEHSRSLQARPGAGPSEICLMEVHGFRLSFFDSLGHCLCGEGMHSYQTEGPVPEVGKAMGGEIAFGLGFNPAGEKEYSIAYPVREDGNIMGVLRLSRTLAEEWEIRNLTLVKIFWVGISFVIFLISVNLAFNSTRRGNAFYASRGHR